MPADKEEKPKRKSMVGAPPSAKRPKRSAASTPVASTPVRGSARSAKKQKLKEEAEKSDGEEKVIEETSDVEEDSEKEDPDSDDYEDAQTKTPASKKASRKRKRAPLTEWHLKKKKILANRANKEKEKSKKQKMEVVEEDEPEEPPKTPPPPARPPPSYKKYNGLQLLMDFMLKKIIDKDPEEYFTHPVTKEDAPDYHTIIQKPMDFQTIGEKIEDNLYNTLAEMKEDLELIVKNAHQYNRPNEIFYLAANRLTTIIHHYFAEQQLRHFLYVLPFAKIIPMDKIGLEEVPRKVLVDKYFVSQRGVLADGMTTDQCLGNADDKIRKNLSARKANGDVSFLGEKDGTVVLNTLSERGIYEDSQLTIGDFCPFSEGTPGLLQRSEHRMNAQVPISYVDYGPFASFAPQYDSTWATMSKSESDLYWGTNGDRKNSIYSQMTIIDDSEENWAKAVDGILDTFSNGEYSKEVQKLEEEKREKLRELEKEANIQEAKKVDVRELIESVSTLEGLDYDVSFLEDVRKKVYLPKTADGKPEDDLISLKPLKYLDVQQKLDYIGQGIVDLATLQANRLAEEPYSSINLIPVSSEPEQKLAERLQEQLGDQIMKHLKPAEIVSDETLHKAMGVNVDDSGMFNDFFSTQ